MQIEPEDAAPPAECRTMSWCPSLPPSDRCLWPPSAPPAISEEGGDGRLNGRMDGRTGPNYFDGELRMLHLDGFMYPKPEAIVASACCAVPDLYRRVMISMKTSTPSWHISSSQRHGRFRQYISETAIRSTSMSVSLGNAVVRIPARCLIGIGLQRA